MTMGCTPCEQAGQKAKRGKSVCVVFNPGIQMPGTPTVGESRLSAAWLVGYVYAWGMKYTLGSYPSITREHVLVACWWAGRFGPRKWRKVMGEWAGMADAHLWHDCVRIPDPPRNLAGECREKR